MSYFYHLSRFKGFNLTLIQQLVKFSYRTAGYCLASPCSCADRTQTVLLSGWHPCARQKHADSGQPFTSACVEHGWNQSDYDSSIEFIAKICLIHVKVDGFSYTLPTLFIHTTKHEVDDTISKTLIRHPKVVLKAEYYATEYLQVLVGIPRDRQWLEDGSR